MISQTSEYALRAVVCLASYPEQELSTAQISRQTKVPTGYLSKVLQRLARSGLVSSIGGRSGGFRITRTPEKISLLDIVGAVEPLKRITRCPLGNKEHSGNLCPLHQRLDDLMATIEHTFSDCSIAELLDKASQHKSLCMVKPSLKRKRASSLVALLIISSLLFTGLGQSIVSAEPLPPISLKNPVPACVAPGESLLCGYLSYYGNST